MAAYLIFLREGAIVDQAAMERYRGSNRTTPPLPKPEPLVVYGGIDTLKGEPPDGVVVLRFASVDDAKAWYHSPAYQRAMPHRKRAAPYRVFIVTGP